MTSSRKINRILIANRGEIACRIIRTCKRLGIEVVAVTSLVDKDLPHARQADFSVVIGEGSAKESYLNINKIIAAAKEYQVDAVHPGYGFLSENADFAEALQTNDIIFIGPTLHAIRAMGSKSEAKEIAEKVGVSIIKGYRGEVQDVASLLKKAQSIGFPLLIKATHGGGGKGMRLVDSEAEFSAALESCQREALSAFGNATVMLEAFIKNPRHIEVQIFGDTHGNVIALSERDCSLQRRHQKVIEEAPALGFTQEIIERLRMEAVTIAKAVRYQGAGTVEFLVNNEGEFYFLEMNTRLQVEHPATEEILGLDLVEWQIRVAEGMPLPLSQADIKPNGHAIEVRLYAEDPDNEFLPSTGTLTKFDISSQCRFDAGYITNNQVSVFYDPMLAKLIVKADNRNAAIEMMRSALIQSQIEGVKTNQKFLLQLLSLPEVAEAYPNISFIDNLLKKSSFVVEKNLEGMLSAALLIWKKSRLQDDGSCRLGSPWSAKDDWRFCGFNEAKFLFSLNGEGQEASATTVADSVTVNLAEDVCKVSHVTLKENELTYFYQDKLIKVPYTLSGGRYLILVNKEVHEVGAMTADAYHGGDEIVDKQLNAPMPGRVISVLSTVGLQVNTGTPLMILEAMKMEHTIRAPFAGVVESIFFSAGDFVEEGTELVSISEYKETDIKSKIA